MGWIWILIPLTALSIPVIAIISGVVEKYIKAQERQANLMTEEFIAEMTALKEATEERNQSYEKRIANLETIVSSMNQNQQIPALPEPEERYAMPKLEQQKSVSNDEKVAMMAEKLKQ